MELMLQKLATARTELWERPWQVAGLIVLLAGIAIVHYLAIEHGWYWEYRWLDIPMHFFGGVAVGWATILCCASGLAPVHWSRFAVVLVGILAVALAWELFEYAAFALFNVPLPPGYWADTLLDLFMGTVGAIAAWIAAHLIRVQ